MSKFTKKKWMVCQFGAREHYAVARTLSRMDSLVDLVTDIWIPPSHPLKLLCGERLAGRYHSDLASIHTQAWTTEALTLSLAKWRRMGRWERIMAQNEWFSRKAGAVLNRRLESQSGLNTFFSYSYTAGLGFERARKSGISTVLGQIDGGIVESQRIAELHARFPNAGSAWNPAPSKYWDLWRRELDLADNVVVNSDWSKKCLLESGWIDSERISIIPLAYARPPETAGYQRTYPVRFSESRPLRCLYLGQATLRKGILPLLEAINSLRNHPVELTVVGPIMIEVPEEIRVAKNIRIMGPVPRSQVQEYYKSADLFVFPTYSDGFGLTQLEAQAWRLPILATQYCGKVIDDGISGIVMQDVSVDELRDNLLTLLQDLSRLKQMSENSVSLENWSIQAIGQQYHELM